MSGDSISRKAVIDEMYDLIGAAERLELQIVDVLERVSSEMPSAEKTGKWIHGRELSRKMIGDCIIAIRYDGWKCSECGCLVEEEREPLYKFCPNCGARMEGGQNG